MSSAFAAAICIVALVFAQEPSGLAQEIETCPAGQGFYPAAQKCAICNGPCETGFPGVCAKGIVDCSEGRALCRATIRPGDLKEQCNGEDDNCDGRIEEGFDKDEDGYTTCKGDCDDHGAGVHPDAAERCDGKDNNCDGLVDERFNVGRACTSGLGQCARQGVLRCSADGLASDCDAKPGSPSREICDGRDNDCDGVLDNDLGEVACGTGACRRTASGCQDGKPGVCVPGEPSVEFCGDGIDNDCDGRVDEGFEQAGKTCSAGVGACMRTGSHICDESKLRIICDAVAANASAEICGNLIDDDCDGAVDNTAGLGETCNNGLSGECYRAGKQICDAPAGKLDCSAPIVKPEAEICDGRDNDCDGRIDNGVTNACGGCGALPGKVGEACMVAEGDECAAGRWACRAESAGEMECALAARLTDGRSCAQDGNPCTRDICSGGSCSHDPYPDGQACRSGNACTSHDVCMDGECAEGQRISCDDRNSCTEDLCDESKGCAHKVIGSGVKNACGGCERLAEDPGEACELDGKKGICSRGAFTCLSDGGAVCVQDKFQSAEICNGLDDDCNAVVDDGLGKLQCGLGACQVSVESCAGGKAQECKPLNPNPESCSNKGADDDCNGVIDDIATLGDDCPISAGTCIIPGRKKCVGDAVFPLCVALDQKYAEDDDGDGIPNYCDRGDAVAGPELFDRAGLAGKLAAHGSKLFDVLKTRAVILPWKEALSSAVVNQGSPDQALLIVSGTSGADGGIAALWAKELGLDKSPDFSRCPIPQALIPRMLATAGADVYAYTSSGYVRYPRIASQIPSAQARNFHCALKSEAVAQIASRKWAFKKGEQSCAAEKIGALELISERPVAFAGAVVCALNPSSFWKKGGTGIGIDIVAEDASGAFGYEFLPFMAGDGDVKDLHVVPLGKSPGDGIFVTAFVAGKPVAGACSRADGVWKCFEHQLERISAPVSFAAFRNTPDGRPNLLLITSEGAAYEALIYNDKGRVETRQIGSAALKNASGEVLSAVAFPFQADRPVTLLIGRSNGITAALIRGDDGSLHPIPGELLTPQASSDDIYPGMRFTFGRPHALAQIPLKPYGGRDLFASFEIVNGSKRVGEMGFFYMNENEPPTGSIDDILFDGTSGSAKLVFKDPSGDALRYRASIRAAHGGLLDDWIDGMEGGLLRFSVKRGAATAGLWPIEITVEALDPGGLTTASRAIMNRDGSVESITELSGAMR